MRIDQIINSNKVKTLTKLIPKEPLGKGIKDHPIKNRKKDDQGNGFINFGVKELSWHKKEVDNKRDDVVEVSNHIIKET